MGRVIKMNDGNCLTIFGIEDAYTAIGEHASPELACYVREYVEECMDVVQTTAEIANEECESMEASVESYHHELDDVANVLSSILYNMKATQRINKAKLIDTLTKLEDEIRSYL